jgi:hypothetical protein
LDRNLLKKYLKASKALLGMVSLVSGLKIPESEGLQEK